VAHRDDIDGLRAVAVLAVIFFHAEFEVFAGGYVGVDVFFVISGFLITSIIQGDLERGSFSFLDFYERRARRLLPALMVMLVTVASVSFFVYPSARFAEILGDVVHASWFTANVNFWQGAGYFEADGLSSPLLHTWSLSVEEQFYFVLPVALFALRRRRQRTVFVAVAVVALASSVFAQWSSTAAPDAGFFLLFGRAWELLAGSLAAMTARRFGTRARPLVASCGLVMVLGSILIYDASTPFPSVYTLAPVVGTVMLLLFGAGATPTARVLGATPMTAIGLVSYSAYLWHQPVLAIARVQTARERLPTAMTLALIVLTFALAWGSWRFVEQPFRRPPTTVARSRGAVGVAAVSVLIVGATAGAASSVITPSGDDSSAAASSGEFVRSSKSEAAAVLGVDRVLGTATVVSRAGTPARCRALAFGDSHTGHLSRGFAERFVEATGCEIHLWTLFGCPSLLGWYKVYDLTQTVEPPEQVACRSQVDEWEAFVERSGADYDIAILSSRWNRLVAPEAYTVDKNIERHAVVPMTAAPTEAGELDDAERLVNLTDALRTTVDTIRGHGPVVVLIAQPPVQLFDLRNLEIGSGYEEAAPMRSDAAARHEPWTQAVESSGVATMNGVVYVDPFETLFCPIGIERCQNTSDGRGLYHDSNHLSAVGSERLADIVLRRLDQVPWRQGE
jgi:peptidoglycan/LPS O-acetylase OafA/YrhL